MVSEAIMPFSSSVELEDGPKAEKRQEAGTLEQKEARKMVVQSTIQNILLVIETIFRLQKMLAMWQDVARIKGLKQRIIDDNFKTHMLYMYIF
jgi:hypothetical protein